MFIEKYFTLWANLNHITISGKQRQRKRLLSSPLRLRFIKRMLVFRILAGYLVYIISNVMAIGYGYIAPVHYNLSAQIDDDELAESSALVIVATAAVSAAVHIDFGNSLRKSLLHVEKIAFWAKAFTDRHRRPYHDDSRDMVTLFIRKRTKLASSSVFFPLQFRVSKFLVFSCLLWCCWCGLDHGHNLKA
uniref:Uncharacterized protein n=1 Tax=Glossina pallidipes TaxID=7398 RepID=A0A1B0GGP8_GLOPL